MPTNFFAESEQIAFDSGHLPPGIDVTNDPLLQGRLHMDVKAGGGERALAKHAAGSSDASNCDLLD